MFDPKTVSLGIAPIGWCNDDMPELGAENTFQQTVSEMALAGFTGCEIGNKYPTDPVVLKKALAHEKLVTASIDAIYAAAYEARDFRAMQMLDWFIKEQGEEEKNAADLITKMELFGGDSKGLYMLNSELKARVYTAPSLVL